MTEFAPEDFFGVEGREEIEQLSDAFLAAGLYLSDWGATSQTYNDEIGAATAYLCGTNRLTQRCQAAGGAGYRYQVMKKATEYQEFVDQGILR